MSQRLQKSWTVLESIDNAAHDRCVDFFRREDDTFGFEEFRRDVEDGGRWTPVQHYAAAVYASSGAALEGAERSVGWLVDVLSVKTDLRSKLA